MPNPHDQVQQNTVERQERPRVPADQQVSASVVHEAYSPSNVRAARCTEPVNGSANLPGQSSDDCFGKLFPGLDLNTSLKGFEIGESNYQQVGDSLKCGDTNGARHHLVDAMRNESQGLTNLTKWEQQNSDLLSKDPYSAQELAQVEKSMRQSLQDGSHAYEELMEGDTCGAKRFADSAANGATDASRNLQTAQNWIKNDTPDVLANLPPLTLDGPPQISPCGGGGDVQPVSNTGTTGGDGEVIPAPPQPAPPELPPAPPVAPPELPPAPPAAPPELPPAPPIPPCPPGPPQYEPPVLPPGGSGYHPLPHPGYHPPLPGNGGDGHGVAPAPPGHATPGGDGTVITGTNTAGPIPSGGDGTVISGTNTAGPLPPGIKPGPDYEWQQAKQRGFLSHHDSGGDFDNDLRENVSELMTMGYGAEDAVQMVATHEHEEGGGGRSVGDFLNGWNPKDYHPPITPNGQGPAALWQEAKQAGFMAHNDSGGDFDNDLRENFAELKNMGFNADQAMQMVSLFENEEGGHDRSTGDWLNGMNPYA